MTRLLLLVGFCVGCTPRRASERPAGELTDSLLASDTAAVLALAAQFGIPSPASMTARIKLPSGQVVGCPVITVESPVTVDGNRRSWLELEVRRKGRDTGGHRCEVYTESGATTKHQGRWVASSAERTERTLWRVNDGDWHIDVSLDTTVSYDSATLIVQAVRRQRLVNQIPAALRRLFGDTLPTINASEIRGIARNRENLYTVWTGEAGGVVFYVSIVAGQVLVHNVGSWRS